MSTTPEPAAPGQGPAKPTKAPVEPLYQPVREVRFAVVLYGGTSLAIYMNGIAQELLKMVRSTAPAPDRDEWVRRGKDDKDWKRPDEVPLLVPSSKLAGSEHTYRRIATRHGAIRQRFVVDVLSGTSAGGLNGLFLAKALAGELPDMKALETLWIEEGDLDKLLNDKGSRKDLPGLPVEDPPDALLNSDRMYVKLLDAISKMPSSMGEEKCKGPEEADPPNTVYVDELDLFMTATDLQGLNLPIHLTDGDVVERRHRAVFHFRFAKSDFGASGRRNDFCRENDPFLAFVARCTSCIVPAFRPMRLGDIGPILNSGLNPDQQSYHWKADARIEDWKSFFRDYWSNTRIGPNEERQKDARLSFLQRDFGDGGYLDQAPFTHATSRLAKRRADLPVDRILLYVEPSPADVKTDTPTARRKNVLEHAAAPFLIPMTDTIRADIDAVRERNGLLDRLATVLRAVEDFPEVKLADNVLANPADNWQSLSPADLAYFHMRASDATDRLASALCSARGFETGSPYSAAVRVLVKAWRNSRYSEKPVDPDKPWLYGEFLDAFDLGFHLRRLTFIQRKMNTRLRADDEMLERQEELAVSTGTPPDEKKSMDAALRFEAIKTGKRRLSEVERLLHTLANLLAAPSQAKFDRAMAILVAEAGEAGAALFNNGDLHLHKQLEGLGFDLEALGKIVSASPRGGLSIEEVRYENAETYLNKEKVKVSTSDGSVVEENIKAALDEMARRLELVLPAFLKAMQDQASTVLGADYLGEFKEDFQSFHSYDAAVLPLTFGTGAGESAHVDILRVSPLDAKSLAPSIEEAKSKLAGTLVANFGAFFHKDWRREDILWGRLDAAERIVCSVMKNDPPEKREVRIAEAQLGILGEGPESTAPLRHRLALRALKKLAAKTGSGLLRELGDADVTPETKVSIERLLKERGLEEPEEPHRRSTLSLGTELEWVGRSLDITGRMFQGLEAVPETAKQTTGRMALLGRLLTALVRIATPGSFPAAMARHWFGMLVLFAIVGFILGSVINAPALQTQAQNLLMVTLAAGALSKVLRHATSPAPLTTVFKSLVILAGLVVGVLVLLFFATTWTDGMVFSIELQIAFEIGKALILAGAVTAGVAALATPEGRRRPAWAWVSFALVALGSMVAYSPITSKLLVMPLPWSLTNWVVVAVGLGLIVVGVALLQLWPDSNAPRAEDVATEYPDAFLSRETVLLCEPSDHEGLTAYLRRLGNADLPRTVPVAVYVQPTGDPMDHLGQVQAALGVANEDVSIKQRCPGAAHGRLKTADGTCCSDLEKRLRRAIDCGSVDGLQALVCGDRIYVNGRVQRLTRQQLRDLIDKLDDCPDLRTLLKTLGRTPGGRQSLAFMDPVQVAFDHPELFLSSDTALTAPPHCHETPEEYLARLERSSLMRTLRVRVYPAGTATEDRARREMQTYLVSSNINEDPVKVRDVSVSELRSRVIQSVDMAAKLDVQAVLCADHLFVGKQIHVLSRRQLLEIRNNPKVLTDLNTLRRALA